MLRAVIYCRVSTDEETQTNSLESQIQQCLETITKNKWIHIYSYIDEGKSGTTTKHRNAYQKLLQDMEQDKFDIIVVKNQDRLMRNTKEWYHFIDKLTRNEKKLYFYMENKFYSPDDTLITGIKAILAEEYSRDLSRKINNAHRNRQKNGSSVLITSKTWGYDKKGKQVVINEKEAEIVKLIYTLCLQGYGSRCISKILSEKGVKSRVGSEFSEVTIRRIIRNPLFKGTVVMNKRHINFETKKVIYTDEKEWIVHKNIVPAIVTEQIWQQANEIMDKRCNIKKTENFSTIKKGKNKGNYELSSKIYCGECGNVYWRRHRKTTKGIKVIEWLCSQYVKRGRKTFCEGGCNNIHIKNDDLEEVLCNVSKKIYKYEKDKIVKSAVNILKKVLEEKEDIQYLQQQKEKIMKKKEILLDRYLEQDISLELFQRKYDILEQEYNICCKAIIQKIQQEKATLNQKRLCNIENELKYISEKELYIHKLLNHIEKIEVYQNRLQIYFDILDTIQIKIEQFSNKTKKFTICENNK